MRKMIIRSIVLLLIVLGITASCSKPQPRTYTPDKSAPVITAEDLASHKVDIKQASAGSLENLLFDLCGRRQYDRSQHQGQPGPNTPYLSQWIGTIRSELELRGYTVDDQNQIHQPDGTLMYSLN